MLGHVSWIVHQGVLDLLNDMKWSYILELLRTPEGYAHPIFLSVANQLLLHAHTVNFLFPHIFNDFV